MKIFAFTDTHGNTRFNNELSRKAALADIIVCPGDFTVFENDMDRILRFIDGLGKPVVLIHGNHESESNLLAVLRSFKNIHFIHKTYFIYGEYLFFGYGGDGFSMSDNRFDVVLEVFMKELSAIEKKNSKKYKLIFITHGPPHNTTLDKIYGHVGNLNYRRFIEQHQPLLAISGHIHETFYAEDRIGKTMLINPGPEGRIIEL
jgi:Icc-related predicted phosphoesterase